MKFVFIILIGIIQCTFSLPVKEKKQAHEEETLHPQPEPADWESQLEYGRYLKEVFNALENDEEFRKMLGSADPEDIKTGKIAENLHFADHKVRNKLDELKRNELERLRHIAVQQYEREIGDRSRLKISIPTAHLDHQNPSRFEANDLKKLISQLNKDIEIADQMRKKEFVKHEMEKEYEYNQQLRAMDEEKKKEAQRLHEEQIKKHKDHPKLHHPGSRQQLEEVWEEQDHMASEDFDPKTFFKLHDLDGNDKWDQEELMALFQKELDKMYDPNAPEDDMNERYEEMERMREHVFRESDIDHDNFISLKEFMDQTKKDDFARDEGWEGLDEQDHFSQQEYEEFERQRNEEIQKLIDSGAIQPPPGFAYYPAHPEVPHQGQVPVVPHGMPPQGQIPVVPQGYQPVAQGGYQAVPQNYQVPPPQGYQAVPQGYQAVPQGYQAAPQGYQPAPQGYQAVPQGYQAVPQGYQAVPQGHQAVGPPQGQAVSNTNIGLNQAKPEHFEDNSIKANLQPLDKKPEGDHTFNQVPQQPAHPAADQVQPGHHEKTQDSLGHLPPVQPIESNRIPHTK